MLRLRDEHWERIREHFPEERIPEGRAGRKPISAREVLEAVLWILNTGPSGTCSRSAIPTTRQSIAAFRSGVGNKCCEVC
jgi:transposase